MICENLSEGLLFVSCDGLIELINTSACKLLDLEASHVQGNPYTSYFTDIFFGVSMKELLSNRKSSFKVMVTLTKGSQLLEIEAGLTPILSKGVMIILRDLTEQRRLEQAVLHNERLKELGQMAATLAHEIRNPLGGIQGFASLLASDLKDLPAQQKMAKEIVEGASVLNQLVTNVLHYARP